MSCLPAGENCSPALPAGEGAAGSVDHTVHDEDSLEGGCLVTEGVVLRDQPADHGRVDWIRTSVLSEPGARLA